LAGFVVVVVVVDDVVVVVVPVPQACCAWARSAATFCWSVPVVASSWVRVF